MKIDELIASVERDLAKAAKQRSDAHAEIDGLVSLAETEKRDNTDEEQTRNDCFMPCCSRAKTSRLVLDL